MDAGSVLNFGGGALAFMAVVVPIVVRSWRRAVARGTHVRVMALTLVGISVLCLIGATVARFAYHNYLMACILIACCLVFVIIEFVRRPWDITRGEIVALVILIVAAHSLLMGAIDVLEKRAAPKTRETPPQTSSD